MRFPGAARFQCAWASAYKTRVAPALPKHYNKAHAPGKSSSSSSLSGSWIACLIIEVIEERLHCITNWHSVVIFLSLLHLAVHQQNENLLCSLLSAARRAVRAVRATDARGRCVHERGHSAGAANVADTEGCADTECTGGD